MFESQKSGNKTSSGEIGLDIRTQGSHDLRIDLSKEPALFVSL